MPVATYTVADASSAQIAVAFKWRVIAPSDVTAAPTSDFSGNAYPNGTGAIAANASPRQAAFQVETLPNTAVTTDRSFDVEIYDVTPAGTTLTVSKVRTKIVEDDSSTSPPPSTNIYGPQTTADTGFISVGSVDKFTLSGNVGASSWEVYLGCEESDGSPGFIIFTGNPERLTANNILADGSRTLFNGINNRLMPNNEAGVDFAITYTRSTKKIVIIVAGTEVFNGNLDVEHPGPYARFRTTGAARTNITIAAA